jgi:uncharacterized integral membrane protein (TIGR00698 family)
MFAPFPYAELYNDIAPEPQLGVRDYVPGLAVSAAATLAAAYLSEHYHAPLTLMALLIGLALNFLQSHKALALGLSFASRTLLRIGIVLVGARVSFSQMVALGLPALLAVVLIVALTLCAGLVAARAFRLSAPFGVLAGGAVAICGASAALALASVLGERRINQAQLTLVLVGISAMSSCALFFYPIMAHQLAFNDTRAGFMLGASIHDVAQALGAGYAYSDAAGQIATIVKLSRVALLAPVMALVALFFPLERGSKLRVSPLPWFVLGFFLLAGLHSMGFVPMRWGETLQSLAAILLACSVTATGIRAPMADILRGGLRPFLVIIAASAVALLGAVLAAFLVIH